MIKALAIRLAWTSCITFCLSANAAEPNLEERLRPLEEKIAQLEEKLAKTNRHSKHTNSRLDHLTSKIKINGFLSTGVTWHNADGKRIQTNEGNELESGVEFIGITRDPSFSPDSILGLQFTAQLSDKATVTTQLLAKGEDNFTPEIEWAYLKYQLTNTWQVRGGRMRAPFYRHSEHLDVGFAYPWVRPPAEVYNLPVSTYTGIDSLYNFNLLSWATDLQLFHGALEDQSEFLPNSGKFDVVNLYGLVLNTSRGPWSFRLGYLQGDLRLKTDDGKTQRYLGSLNTSLQDLLSNEDISLSTETKLPVSYAGLGLTYEKNNILIMTEAVQLKFDYSALRINIHEALSSSLGGTTATTAATLGLPESAVGETDIEPPNLLGHNAYYFTAGYRFNKWLPYINAGYIHEASPLNDTERDNSYLITSGRLAQEKSQQRSLTLGLRYDLSSQLSIKGSIKHFYDFNTVGSLTTEAAMENNEVFTLLIDSIF